MKTTICIIPVLIAAVILLFTSATFANEGKYVEAMQKNIQTLFQAQSIEDFQSAVNTFERIASAEKGKWEPYYYAAFGYIMMARKEKEAARKDNYLDLAMTAIANAKALAPEESEIVALEAFDYMIRVTVDPASRGAQYAGEAMRMLGKASAMNSNNPRALALLAQMQYGTAQFFGSSTAEACATADQALEKFNTFKAESPLAPQWGKGMIEDLKAQCK